jgi:alpha-D-xyloside xylohydrolase
MIDDQERRKTMKGFYQDGNALLWELNHEKMRIEPWGSDSLRVRATMEPEIQMDLEGGLLDPAQASARIEIGPDKAVIHNGGIRAEVLENGNLRFFNAAGKVLLEEDKKPKNLGGWPEARWYQAAQGGLWKIEVRFKPNEDEKFYGLGQQRHGRLNHKGCVIELLHRNTRASIPFVLSTQGYGFLWNNPAIGRVELGCNGTKWVAQATPQIDYWVTAGDTPAEIMQHYADATGHAPMMPEYASGFWQCKLRYATQEQLLEVAREHKRRGLPLSVIVIDFFHWTVQGEWEFDPECWPDPQAMIEELESMGVKVMVSIWPTVSEHSKYFNEMTKRGLLVRNERGIPVNMTFVDNYPKGPVHFHFFDPLNPEARKFVWEKARANYYRYGIKIFWLDEAEPDMWPMEPDNLRYHLGNGLAVANLYPLMYARGFYEGMLVEGETEIINLCRCAWAGSQRYGAATWSGDIDSTFEELRIQVRAGLNMGLSGIPWWTTDIGGFFDGVPEDPYFRELLVRWFQYGAFCPLFRLHGFREPTTWIPTLQGGPNEVWSYGETVYAILKEFLFLRERLRPYIMEQMRLAHEKGVPPMRPLFFDFPADPQSYSIEDQFMFGPNLLVAPVLFEGDRSRPVYLPAGADWTDAWTGSELKGGAQIVADAPLERIPLYLRAGVKLPIHP